MKELKYKGILYFIAAVIAATLCIQGYWIFKNYQSSKQQFLNDVQSSLDLAVDQYYTQLAAKTSFGLIGEDLKGFEFKTTHELRRVHDTLLQEKKLQKQVVRQIDTTLEGITMVRSRSNDSMEIDINFKDSLPGKATFFTFRDRLKDPVETLSSKIIVSFSEDRLSLHKIDSLFSEELKRKNIDMAYGLSDSGFSEKPEVIRPLIIEGAELTTTSKSPYFFHGNELKAHFSNITIPVLQRNVMSFLLSILLVTAVIACLLYLLRIIRHQKQLAEVKNDLIGNITHEFKTPLATIGVAMEAMQRFNAENSSEKTQRYAQISMEQVEKLNFMVEKLLETATLDSDQLQLQFKNEDLVKLFERVTQNDGFLHRQKQLTFTSNVTTLLVPMDIFHFENAVNNIVDNAIKYGGDRIEINLQQKESTIEIVISDSGNSLQEHHKSQIFEKFYRVPKGNTHDVKGFGMGLYYTKKIIEKHRGNISLRPQPHTSFKIVLPYEGAR